MRFTRNVAVALAALAFGAAPAVAIASGGGNSNNAPGHNKSTPSTSMAKAYGKYCQGDTKKHSSTTGKGTPFSQCVLSMAHAAKNPKMTAKQACAIDSKKHVAGQKGTPYSICLKGVAKLRASTKS